MIAMYRRHYSVLRRRWEVVQVGEVAKWLDEVEQQLKGNFFLSFLYTLISEYPAHDIESGATFGQVDRVMTSKYFPIS